MKNEGISATASHDARAGWLVFRESRQIPAPMFVREHGNLKHGRYSKQGIEGMRTVRLCARMLRSGLWNTPVPGFTRRIPLGWAAYRAARMNCTDRHRTPMLRVTPQDLKKVR